MEARPWARLRRKLRRPLLPRLIPYARWRLARVLRKPRLIFVKSRFGLELIRNYRIDRRYGGWCGGSFKTSFAPIGHYGTSSADYSVLPKLFSERNGVLIRPTDVLVDVGCGRGRVLNWWLSLELGNRIIGIEMEERWAREAAARLKPYPNVTVIHGDATEHIPPDGTIFYLFNPFGETLLGVFKQRLLETCGPEADLTLVYHFAMHKHVFENDPDWVVEPVRARTFHPSVIVRRARSPRRITEPAQPLKALSEPT
jgi:SAM-dependent methyltransferase